MQPKISICIPSHNSAKVIAETLQNALNQLYPLKEILVADDGSTDNTVEIVKSFPQVRLIQNETNIGIGMNLVKLMNEAKGKYIVYLCSDDLFTNQNVVGDIVKQFDLGDQNVGVLGRYYYFFMDGKPGAIGVCREKNIILQSCCPSGMAFRKDEVIGVNKIFIEMPSIVVQYLKRWRWSMFEWDTVAARFHPGGNTGTKKEYYSESPTQNWIDLTGDNEFKDFPIFIQLKNRAPSLLWGEIKLHIANDRSVLKDIKFWFYALTALIVPGFILRPLTIFYRHNITRNLVSIIERPSNV